MCDEHRRVRLFAVVLGDGGRDLRGLVELARHRRTDGGVRALDLLVDRLADVVQQAGAARQLDVEPELAGHDAGEEADLDRVRQQVLRVRRAELEPADRAHQLGMHLVQAEVEHRLLAGVLTVRLDLVGALGHDLLDARGMDAPVGDEPRQRQLGDLAPQRIEAADDDRLGRVVDDEVDARRRLERADVATLAADDAPLEIVRRQRHHRDGALGDVLAGVALDGGAEDALGALFGFGLGGVFDLLDLDGGRFLGVVDDLGHELGARLLGGHAGELLEPRLGLVQQLLGAPRGGLGRLLAAGDRLFLLFEVGGAALERALFLGELFFPAAQRLFGFLQLDAALFELVGRLGLRFERDLLGLELRGTLDLGGFGARGLDELGALGFGHGRFRFTEHHHPGDHADDERGETQDDA